MPRDTCVNDQATTWHYEILRHWGSWMCAVTTTNSLPVGFRACSVRAPSPSLWLAPQKPVSICLASPAMTQHWLTDYRTCTHIQIHTSSLCVPLGAWPSLFPWFSVSFHHLSSGMRIPRCVWIHIFFTFTSIEGLTEATFKMQGINK